MAVDLLDARGEGCPWGEQNDPAVADVGRLNDTVRVPGIFTRAPDWSRRSGVRSSLAFIAAIASAVTGAGRALNSQSSWLSGRLTAFSVVSRQREQERAERILGRSIGQIHLDDGLSVFATGLRRRSSGAIPGLIR